MEEEQKQNSQKRRAKGELFSNEALRKLIIPLIIEQILAVTVGMVGYHDGVQRWRGSYLGGIFG